MLANFVKQSRKVAYSNSKLISAIICRQFSSSPEPTKEEIAKANVEWGQKYQDEAFKFEEEWATINAAIDSE